MRTPRKESASNIYHVVARGTGRQLIFEDDDDRRCFLAIMSHALRRFDVEVFGWCLMGNHVHLLLHGHIAGISKAMQVLLGTYALKFNEQTGRSGHLFQERFSSEPIDSDEYLLSALRYIHQNPDKARIATYDSYPWSSYAEYLGEAGPCSTDFILSLFGSRQEYEAFHRIQSDESGFLDITCGRSATRPMPDEDAIRIANGILDDVPLPAIKSLDRSTRDGLIAKLLNVDLSVRQIERLTGVSRGIIDYIKKNLSNNLSL